MAKGPKTQTKSGQWSKDDVKRLKVMFRRISTAEVASALNRSVGSVSAKAYSFRLRKTKKYLKSIGRA